MHMLRGVALAYHAEGASVVVSNTSLGAADGSSRPTRYNMQTFVFYIEIDLHIYIYLYVYTYTYKYS